MTTTLARTEAYTSFERSLAEKATTDHMSLVRAYRQLEDQEQFNALVLAFDTLVEDIRNQGITPRTESLLVAMDGMCVEFTYGSKDEDQRRIASLIEDAVLAGRQIGKSAARPTTYTKSEDLLCVLIGVMHGASRGATLAGYRAAIIAATRPWGSGARWHLDASGSPVTTLTETRRFDIEALSPKFAGVRSVLQPITLSSAN